MPKQPSTLVRSRSLSRPARTGGRCPSLTARTYPSDRARCTLVAIYQPQQTLLPQSLYDAGPDCPVSWSPAGAACGVCWGRRGIKKYASAPTTSGTTVMISMVIITPLE